jgi:hypothetical protein
MDESKNIQILEAMRARMFKIWSGVIADIESDSPARVKRSMGRLSSVSCELRAVAKDHQKMLLDIDAAKREKNDGR